MPPLPDGTFRYTPRDLVAYLEGDFAAWCERMHVERSRTGVPGPHEPAWATPDEADEEAASVAGVECRPGTGQLLSLACNVPLDFAKLFHVKGDGLQLEVSPYSIRIQPARGTSNAALQCGYTSTLRTTLAI